MSLDNRELPALQIPGNQQIRWQKQSFGQNEMIKIEIWCWFNASLAEKTIKTFRLL